MGTYAYCRRVAAVSTVEYPVSTSMKRLQTRETKRGAGQEADTRAAPHDYVKQKGKAQTRIPHAAVARSHHGYRAPGLMIRLGAGGATGESPQADIGLLLPPHQGGSGAKSARIIAYRDY